MEKIQLPRLKGEENYSAWAQHMKAGLILKGLQHCLESSPITAESSPDLLDEDAESQPLQAKIPTIEEDLQALSMLRLCCNEDPLNTIKGCNTAKEAWKMLQNTYKPDGFTTNHLLIREFLQLQQADFDSIEGFVSKVKYLNYELNLRAETTLPGQFILHWVLNTLTERYSGFVQNVTQALRKDPKAYNLGSLLTSLLDENRRLTSTEGKTTVLNLHKRKAKSPTIYSLHARNKGNSSSYNSQNNGYNNHNTGYNNQKKPNSNKTIKKAWKKQKGKWCKLCKKPSHDTNDCKIIFSQNGLLALQKARKDRNNSSINTAITTSNITSNTTSNTTSSTVSSPTTRVIELSDDMDLMDLEIEEPAIDLLDGLLVSKALKPSILLSTIANKIATTVNKIAKLQKEGHYNKVYYTSLKELELYRLNFILDTGAEVHIITDKSFFHSFIECSKTVSWGTAKSTKIQGYGSCYIQFTDTKEKLLLRNCYYMPELGINLISQSQLTSLSSYCNTNTVILFRNSYSSSNPTTNPINNAISLNGYVITRGKKLGKLYYLPVEVLHKPLSILATKGTIDPDLAMHHRLGHIGYNALQHLKNSVIADFTTIKSPINKEALYNCDICLRAKMTNKVNKNSTNSSNTSDKTSKNQPYKVRSDICGPINPITYNKYRYFITFLHSTSKYLEIELLRSKDEALQAYRNYIAKMANINYNKGNKRSNTSNTSNNPIKIRIIATDNGTEYTNTAFQRQLKVDGTDHQLSSPYTKEQNGEIERINRTIIAKVLSMLIGSNLPQYMWGEAVTTAVYLYNRTPHSKLDYKTPYEAYYGIKPNINNIKTFGSLVYFKRKGPTTIKLAQKGILGLLIGFGTDSSHYKVYDLEYNRPIWVRDLKILENSFLPSSNSYNYKNNTIPSNISSIASYNTDGLELDLKAINNSNSTNSTSHSQGKTPNLRYSSGNTHYNRPVAQSYGQGGLSSLNTTESSNTSSRNNPTSYSNSIRVDIPQRNKEYYKDFNRVNNTTTTSQSSITIGRNNTPITTTGPNQSNSTDSEASILEDDLENLPSSSRNSVNNPISNNTTTASIIANSTSNGHSNYTSNTTSNALISVNPSRPNKPTLTESDLTVLTEGLGGLADELPAKDFYILVAKVANNEPTTYKQAITSPEAQHWIQAMQAEITELEAQNTWDLVDLPPNRTALGGRWVYKLKTSLNNAIIRYKARWVVQGFNQVIGIDYLDTFSTTCRPETYRLVFIIALLLDWKFLQYDVKNAFIHAKIDKEIYVKQPTGFERPINSYNSYKNSLNSYYTSNTTSNTPYKVCKLQKALYGLKQSPRLWYKHLLGCLTKLGFIVLPADEGCFINTTYKVILLCHVDDIIAVGPTTSIIEGLLAKLEGLKILNLGQPSTFLGLQLEFNTSNTTSNNGSKITTLRLSQLKYTKNLLKRFNKEHLYYSTPTIQNLKLEKSSTTATTEEITYFQQQVGSLLYLTNKTRPDIAFIVNLLSRFTINPGKAHWHALDHLWGYLNYSPDLGIVLTKPTTISSSNSYDNSYNNSLTLIGYTDSDWANDLVNRLSTTGYIFFFGHCNIVSWTTEKQKAVALSSCEAEYQGLRDVAKEAIFLKTIIDFLFKELNLYNTSIITSNNSNNSYNTIKLNTTTIITDSQSAKDLAENPSFHKRTKHIDVAFHFIRQCIAENKLLVTYTTSKTNLADPLTKGVNNTIHTRFCELIGLK